MAESFFPYDIANLAVGPIRTLVAKDEDLAIPTKIQDVIDMTDPYAVADPDIFEFGAAVNPGTYSRGNTQSDLTIEQDRAAVDTEVTDVSRTLQFNVAELSPAAQAILEQSPGIETIAAASGASAQKAVPFGAFSELDHFRVIFIARRKKKAGLVTEPGGLVRPRMIGVMLYSAAITGDGQSMQFAKGSLVSGDVTFQGYPDPDADPGSDYGRWLMEDAGTIT